MYKRKIIMALFTGVVLASLVVVVHNKNKQPLVDVSYAQVDPAQLQQLLSKPMVGCVMRVGDIKGEARSDKYKDYMEIDSYSFGASRGDLSTGAGAGKAKFNDFHVTKKMDKASPFLMLATAKGTHFPKADLICIKNVKDFPEFVHIYLSDVQVSSFQNSSKDQVFPIDDFSLIYGKIEHEYRFQKADGSFDAPIKTGWDVKENKEI